MQSKTSQITSQIQASNDQPSSFRRLYKDAAIAIYGAATINRLLSRHCEPTYKSDAVNPDRWAASTIDADNGDFLVAWYTVTGGEIDDDETYSLEFIEVN